MSEVLFIQLCRLGDCVQSTVLFASWKHRHPEDRIVVLTLPAFAPVFHSNPDIDELLHFTQPASASATADTNSLLESMEPSLETLRARRFRAVVNLTHDSFSGLLAAALNPEVLRGLSTDPSGKLLAKDPWTLYMLSLLLYRRLNLLNLVDVFAHFSGGPAIRSTPRFFVDEESRRQAAQWLGEKREDGCIIGFQPGANKAERRWPAESFAALGRRLVEKHGARILVFGSRDEEALARSIAEAIPGAKSFAGMTGIPGLAALLERCAILVTNDTGTMHVAAALGVRIVALFESSAYFRETGPYGSGHWIIQSRQTLDYGERSADELSRIRRIPTEAVSVAVGALLAEIRGTASPTFQAGGADHYRSIWSEGVVDYLPVSRLPLEREDLYARLQRPIWLAALDGGDPDPTEAADRAIAAVAGGYSNPAGLELGVALDRASQELRTADGRLRKLKSLVDTTSTKLRRNPSHIVPQDQISKMNELETEVLQAGSLPAVQPFVKYFETALAMVEGANTREFLQGYRRHLLSLEKQLRTLQTIVRAAVRKLSASR